MRAAHVRRNASGTQSITSTAAYARRLAAGASRRVRTCSARSAPSPKPGRTWYRNWYRSERTSPHLEGLKRGRNPASVLRWTLRNRPSKPVSRRSPSVGRFDSCAAPYLAKLLHARGRSELVRHESSRRPSLDSVGALGRLVSLMWVVCVRPAIATPSGRSRSIGHGHRRHEMPSVVTSQLCAAALATRLSACKTSSP
jgi:hypothetical protein